ncbi:unnamed protein product [Ilex paraguariensis]|uniref:Uncharacterized protein n=1 Tax=Ilex paraguariensis TaxID=185542 RepID=A0ABC8R367_9AQUA
MASSSSPPLLLFLLSVTLLNIVVVSTSSHISLRHETVRERREVARGVFGRRILMSFKETAAGGNVTFDCSRSGPCVACAYSEKNDEKYRCSETGYRLPLKCVEVGAASKEKDSKKRQNGRSALENTINEVKPQAMLHNTEELTISLTHRIMLDGSSTSDGGSQFYITYRSCIPAVDEEKLSVLGFEGIMFCMLLLSGSFVYFRRKRTGAMSATGAVRVPTSSRF